MQITGIINHYFREKITPSKMSLKSKPRVGTLEALNSAYFTPSQRVCVNLAFVGILSTSGQVNPQVLVTQQYLILHKSEFRIVFEIEYIAYII